MTDSQVPAPTKWHPPYTAFRTVTDIIDRMTEEEPPSRIDKSYLDNYSGGYQSIVLHALNNLGLREHNGSVTERLRDLVTADQDKRKALIADILREFYGPVLALGTNATQAQMIEAFRELGVNPGDTTRKAVAFFLSAAKYGGVPVSRHWKVPRVAPSGARKRGAAAGSESSANGAGSGIPPEPARPDGSPNARTVQLRSGGTVSLSVSVDLFNLSGDDEEFVLGLVKTMRKYEEQKESVTATATTEELAHEVGDEGAEEVDP